MCIYSGLNFEVMRLFCIKDGTFKVWDVEKRQLLHSEVCSVEEGDDGAKVWGGGRRYGEEGDEGQFIHLYTRTCIHTHIHTPAHISKYPTDIHM